METGGSQPGHGMLTFACLSCTEMEKDMKANGLSKPPVLSSQCQIQRVVLVLTAVVAVVIHVVWGE